VAVARQPAGAGGAAAVARRMSSMRVNVSPKSA
jgi:hypothetical protein